MATTEKKTPNKKRSQWAEVWRRIKKNKMAMAGLIILTVLVLGAIFADFIADYDEVVIKQNLAESLQTPSGKHIFGTDFYGRDIFARMLHGTRVSLQVGLVAVGISTNKLTTLNVVAKNTTEAKTVGVSFCLIASTSSLPTPGHENTVSVKTAPPNKYPNCNPITVITGIKAFLRACLLITFFSATPFALAVLIKSCLITSSIDERVIRVIIAAALVPNVIAGSITLFAFSNPPIGKTLNCTENRIISIKPNQKFGIETPNNAAIILILSISEYCLVADIIPTGIPIIIAIATPTTANTNVLGNLANISEKTSRPLE